MATAGRLAWVLLCVFGFVSLFLTGVLVGDLAAGLLVDLLTALFCVLLAGLFALLVALPVVLAPLLVRLLVALDVALVTLFLLPGFGPDLLTLLAPAFVVFAFWLAFEPAFGFALAAAFVEILSFVITAVLAIFCS